jgi:hypothetical protein
VVGRLTLLVVPLLLVSSLPVGALVVLSSPSAGPSATSTAARPTPTSPAPPQAPSTDVVTVLNQTVGNLSNFWGAGVTSGVSNANATTEVAGTPLDWFVWPAGKLADAFNMTDGQLWGYGNSSLQPTNETQFVDWCRSTACHAIFTVPGEIDSPSTGAYDVWYTEQVLGFRPTYWEVGNEPYGWENWGVPWPSWSSTNTKTVTPLEYAFEVQKYITAMRAVDPTLQFLGLPGVGAGSKPDGAWLNDTILINGPNLTGVAIHDYPAERGAVGGTLTQFMATLGVAKSNPLARITTDESEVQAACPTCSLKFLVDEFGAGTGDGGGWQPFMQTYPEIPYITAELVMFMQANVSNADVFALRSGYNGSLFLSNGTVLPLDGLYTQILPQFDPITLATSLAGPVKGVYAEASESARANSLTLLAVNTNTTQSVTLNASGPRFPSDGAYSIWRADNSSTNPNGTIVHSLSFQSAASWVIPPLGVLLVSVCRSNASEAPGYYAVAFCESGLPAGTNWSVTVNSNTLSSTTGIISFSEPNGTYSYQVGSVPGWRPANLTGSVSVNGAPTSITIPWTVVTFPVTFFERGLPNGTAWSVDLGGTVYRTTGSTVDAEEPNGTYGYALSIVSGWITTPPRGTVFVDITPVNVSNNWTRVTYTLTFHEVGLPVGTPWSVDANGTPGSSTITRIQFQEPNGTYNYTVGSVPGYTPDATSGSIQVKDTVAYVPLTWTRNSSVYSIRFNETGLPAGTSWSVTLNGTTQSGPVDNFTFSEGNGTYPFEYAGAGWSTTPYDGNVTVAGHTAYVTSAWTQVTYPVTFVETGLPTGTPWSVDLNGTTHSSITADVVFAEANGTDYPYLVPGMAGFTTAGSGNVSVHATSSTVNITWLPYLSTVTFNETGLNGASNWTVVVAGEPPEVIYVSQGPWSESLANGTYTYTLSTGEPGYVPVPSQGSFNVAGVRVNITATFEPATYPVTFTESGLPSGTPWSVDLDGAPGDSTHSTVAFSETEGNYSFTIAAAAGYVPSPSNGEVDDEGAPVNVSVQFLPPGTQEYSVSFSETGLSSGKLWHVTLDGVTNSSETSTVTFVEANGTYGYEVLPLPGWTTLTPTGTATVAGANQTIPVTWSVAVYEVTFAETGLPIGTNWSVTFAGNAVSGSSANLTFAVANSTHDFTVAPIEGWTAHPSNGSVPVAGAPQVVDILWTPDSTPVPVVFVENGLPSGTVWSVTLEGLAGGSNTSRIRFTEPAGTYDYAVGGVVGWEASPTLGSIDVTGSTTVTINWTLRVFSVTVTESGLPAGSAWGITVGGANHNATSTSFAFTEPNGTYTYRTEVPSGFTGAPASGTFEVGGHPVDLTLTFTANPTTHPNGPSNSLTAEQVGAVLAVVAIVAVVVGVWLWGRRRPSEPPPGVE